MQVRFHINAAALPPLRQLALGYGIECEDASELLKRYLHALANVPLPVKGGSKKGRKLKITEAQRQQRREQAAEARAKKQENRQPQTQDNGLNAIFGKWPGDETELELSDALKSIS